MSRKGKCWDNAVMERFFGSLKSEWLARDTEADRRGVIEYTEMEYNSCRLHSTLGHQTPREIEFAAAARKCVRSDLTRIGGGAWGTGATVCR